MLPSQYLEKGWTQGTFARDENYKPVNEGNPSAICWCVSGAISIALPMSYELYLAIKLTDEIERITNQSIVAWNDSKNRTHGEVVCTVKRAEENINLLVNIKQN